MSDAWLAHLAQLAVQTVATAGLVLAAVLPVTLSGRKAAKKGEQHAARANEQVSNDHDTNLRDDLDGKHDELRSLIGAVDRRLDGQASDIRGIRRDVGRLTDDQREHEHRIDDLEHTIPPAPRSRWAAPIEGEDHEQHEQHRPGPDDQPEGDRRRRGRRRRDGGGSGG